MTGYSTNEGGNAALTLNLKAAGPRDANTPPRPTLMAMTVFLGLHDTEPGLTGYSGTEIAGGGYTRQRCWWTVPGNKTSALGGGWDDDAGLATTSVVFESLPDGVVRWFGVWSTVSGSTGLLFAIQRPTPLTISTTESLTVPALDLVIGPY